MNYIINIGGSFILVFVVMYVYLNDKYLKKLI